MKKNVDALRSFLDSVHSPYHAAAVLTKMLQEDGYVCLNESTPRWDLEPGGKYYLTRGGSSVIAFRIPEQTPVGFIMTASHSDHPTFKLKENGELTGKYTRAATELYGGMLIFSWLDRPLSLAGRVLVQTENGVHSTLVDIDRDLLMIPNVAIHLNREVNEGYNWNVAVDTLPLLGGAGAAGKLETILQEAAGGEILGHDLYVYIRQKASVWGVEEEYLSAAGLDDLACVWGCMQGFLQAQSSSAIPVLCVFDNEEIGSKTYQGAESDLLLNTLRRISAGVGKDLRQLLAQSFMISADNAQAVHPNHPQRSDANAPVVNGGVAVKFHADRKYTTDGASAAVFRKICQDAGVKLQTFYNRADMKSGSTLGNVSLVQVSVNSVDIGLPQLAMHSCYETVGVKDVLDLVDIMTAYYSRTLEVPEDGTFIIR